LKQFIFSLKEKIIRHKVLVQNFSYLSIIQIINLPLSIITYPYLIRVLGKDTYGIVIFAQAVVVYLVVLVGFGFNISATHEVSVYRDNKEKLNEIVSSVLIIKSVLFFVALLILCCLLIFIPRARGYELLFIISMWPCLYDVIFPSWYFQGIERMKYITYITLISRVIFLALIFIFVRKPEDYLLVPAIYGLGYIIAGIISLYIVFSKHKIKFNSQDFKTLKLYFYDSVPIFVSNLSTSLYATTSKVFVGAFLGMGEVAYYDLAEKVTALMKIPQSMLNLSLFPKISKEKNIDFVKQMFKISMIINILLFIVVILSSKYIILLLGGKEMLPAQVIVNILALTVPVIAISNVFGIQVLIPFGHNKTFSNVIVTSGFVYFLMLFFLWFTLGFSVIGISTVTLITEIFTSVYMFHFCKKYQIWK